MTMTIPAPPMASVTAQDWESQTVFKDTVLGYIHVPKAVVHKVIDHEIFQRLHDIAQTGMASLYPGATHNRFCHSVGVYYLGKLAFERFQNNVKQQYGNDIYLVATSEVSNDRVWARWRFLFEMSCLLHDCGHSPLSHTLEFLYDEYPQREAVESNKVLLDTFQGDPDFKEQFCPKQKLSACGAPHERMSAAMLVQKDGYYDILYELITSYLDHYDSGVIHVAGAERCDAVYGDSEFRSDLQFMVRAIIGCHYTENSDFWEYDLDPDKKRVVYQLRNCIISLLHSTIDVDNIDYSIRDASLSGYKSTQVDYERLLTANTVVKAYDHTNFELKDEPFDYSVCLREFVSAEATPEHPLSMTISGSATLLLEGDDLQGMVLTGNIVEEDGVCGRKPVRIVHLKKGSSVHILLEHKSVKITPRDVDRNIGAQLHIRGSSDTGTSHGKLSGVINGTIFVGAAPPTGEGCTAVWQRICADKTKLNIYPAYHKSAMSVIQGALDASNFEHLWIYSHHITTYCNNYLSVYLLEQYADYCYWKEYTPFLDYAGKLLRILGESQLCPEEMQRETSLEEQKNYVKEAAVIRNVKYKEYANIVQGLPETLPKRFGEFGLALIRTLFSLLKTLRAIPRRHGEELFKSAASALCQLVETSAIPVGEDRDRLRETSERLSLADSEHPKDHLGGSAVMRDLLGMPCVKQANGQNYLRTSDADLRSMYHALTINASDQDKAAFPELFDAIRQYESRCYLHPMWKSHTEFNFYTHGWNREWFIPLIELEKKKRKDGPSGGEPIFDLRSLSRIQYFFRTSKSPINRKNGFELYTSLSDGAVAEYGEILGGFWKKAKERFHLRTLVYVPQCIRHKDIDSSATYIVWKNRVVTLQDLGFQINQSAGRDYFYLYYRCEGDAGIDVMEFMDFLKEQIGVMETIAETPDESASPSGEAGGCPSNRTAEQEGAVQ